MTLSQVLVSAALAGGSTLLGLVVIRPISDWIRARQEADDEAQTLLETPSDAALPTAAEPPRPQPRTDTKHPARAA
ncbi:hypothetical protein [Kitasatospora sp. MBT63]|uniref:hypothetical protein n=1 Tax=Kitasatospora sp. MBT63 TaxID=1444768 RepID=UPI00053AD6BC|nr:hypothetical protein [Kitasatospora sp. MBT63]